MLVKGLVVFLVTLGVSSGNYLSEDFDEVNSRKNFAQKSKDFLNKDDNGLSEQCVDHMFEYVHGLLKRKIWALKMFDASSKFPSGIMDGNFADLGFFDECLDVESRTLFPKSPNIFGQYCIGTLPFRKDLNKTQKQLPNALNADIFQPTTRVATPDSTLGLQFGICVPDACSATEIHAMFAGIGLNMSFYDQLCQTKADKPKFDAGSIATISFLGVIMWIMIVCTAYDVALHYLGKKSPHPLLTAFSVLTNGKKLIATHNGPNQISCLHGIRVISTMWIILGHRYSIQASSPIRNTLDAYNWINSKAHMFILNAPLSVDTFFLMSGLVVAYMYMSAVTKGVKFNILLFYIHRYLRLTPVLAVIIVIHITLVRHFGSGPMYPNNVQNSLIDGCERYWWKTLLYAQNYGSQESMCIPQSWYLCVDTQLFFLSPIILIPLSRWPIPTLLATGSLTLCSMLVSFLTGWFLELNTNIAGNAGGGSIKDYMKWYYFATQTRAGPWFIGIVLGYYIFQAKQRKVRLVLNKGLILAVWAASLAILCTCLFTGHNLIFIEYDRVANSIHMALVRPAWAVGLSWIIFACVIGYGGPVNWFLSLPLFQVLSKFTYTLYLLHLQVITILVGQMRTPPVFSDGRMLYTFWGDFALSLAISAVFTLAFESPMITIEQALLARKNKKEIKQAEPESFRYVEKYDEIAP